MITLSYRTPSIAAGTYEQTHAPDWTIFLALEPLNTSISILGLTGGRICLASDSAVRARSVMSLEKTPPDERLKCREGEKEWVRKGRRSDI